MVIFVSSSEIRYDKANASRMLHLSNEFNKLGIPTIIIGSYSENNADESNIIEVKPYSQNLIGRIFLRVQIPYIALKQMINTRSKFCIVRGFDMPLFAILAKLSGRKMIYDFHGYMYKEEIARGSVWRAKITRIFDLLMLQLADHILTVSEGIYNELGKRHREKTIILPNGVDPEAFNEDLNDKEKDDLMEKYGIKANKKVIGFIGSLSEWFRLEDLIDVQKYTEDDFCMLIVGDGKSYSKLKTKTMDSNRVIMTGRIPHDDAMNLLKCAIDVCIIPYKEDWFGSERANFFSSRKITEYLMAGKTIIISKILGNPTFLKLNENYIDYSPGDSIDLTKKIQYILENDEIRLKMVQNNIELSKNFTWECLLNNSGLIDILMLEKIKN